MTDNASPLYSISIIIPIYNEADLLSEALNQIDGFLAKYFQDYEILIIESGSTDNSAVVCNRLEQEYDNVRVIHEGARNGFGSALRIGYKNATKDLIWMITADLPFPLEAILVALPLFEQHDCVLSYRQNDPRDLWRKLQSWLYNSLVKITLGLRVQHVNSAFKVYKRDLLQNMRLTSYGWLLDVEILYRLKENQATYIEIPVPMLLRSGGRSSITYLTPLSIFMELISFYRSKNS